MKKPTLLSKLTAVLSGGSTEQLLKTVFAPLAKDNPRLARDLATFCHDGEPATVLAQARQVNITDPYQSFGPCFTTRWFAARNKAASAKARMALYHKAIAGTADLLIVIRMAKALAEVLSQAITKHTQDAFPDWLHLVLTDWIQNTQDYPHQPVQKAGNSGPPLSLPWLSALCETEGLHPADWLPYYLDRQGVGSYWNFDQFLRVFRRLEGMTAFIAAHADYLVDRLYPGFSAAGKANCLVELGVLELTDHCSNFIAQQTVSSSKTVRAEASRLLASLPPERYRTQIEHFLHHGKAAERNAAAEFIGRNLGDQGRPLLEAALQAESSNAVASTLRIALGSTAVEAEAETESPLPLPDYDRPDPDTRVSDEVIELFHAQIRQMQERYRDIEPQYPWQKKERKYILSLSRAHAAAVVATMNGGARTDDKFYSYTRIRYEPSLYAHSSIGLINVLRLYEPPSDTHGRRRPDIAYGPLPHWLKQHRDRLRDLRTLDHALKALGWPRDTIESEILGQSWSPSLLFTELPPEGIWPYFAQRPDILQSALSAPAGGHSGGLHNVCMDRVLEVLDCFPTLPGPYRAPLLQLALGEGKTYRERAQMLLAEVPGIEWKVAEALKSAAQESRINAARWLARLGKPEAVAPIREALAKESREAVRATLLSALETLGEDISELLSPKLLLKEAQKGLKKRLPKSLEWFPFETLPALRWNDGGTVDPALPRWWVVLACKLKDPGGSELLLKYLQRLDPASRQALGLHILHAFMTQDTLCRSHEEAESEAAQRAPGLLQQWKQWAKWDWGKSYAQRTLEEAHAAIKAEVLGTYLGSAIKDKGILSLCAYAPGAEAVALMRAYMKDHYTRRAQIEAMLKALAPGNDNHVIQLLLSVSRRYRTRSVQETARQLIEEIAERNGWSQEQLADRTMPTAGFDENGELQLDYGSRQFTISLDDKLKPLLKNADGKVIKSLPTARQADDAALVKEAKSRFSACKKELKQVTELTTSRLYEAMCAGRTWTLADWNEYLFAHPIANRLTQRLIWRLENGGEARLFRPTEDGALIDCEDEELRLGDSGDIRLAHRTLMPQADADAWRAHLKDYGVAPLFEQISRPLPGSATDLEKRSLNDYEGYLSDSFTLRGVFTKLGYQRGEAEDGGFFYYYHKAFGSLGLRAVIQFSGNCLPEENIPAALTSLSFTRLNSRGWIDEDDMVPLKQVPPILLSEVLADYRTLADKTGGYAADWQKKIPW